MSTARDAATPTPTDAADPQTTLALFGGAYDVGEHEPRREVPPRQPDTGAQTAIVGWLAISGQAQPGDLLEERERESKTEVRILACPVCAYRFTRNERRDRHLTNHPNEAFALAPMGEIEGGDEQR